MMQSASSRKGMHNGLDQRPCQCIVVRLNTIYDRHIESCAWRGAHLNNLHAVALPYRDRHLTNTSLPYRQLNAPELQLRRSLSGNLGDVQYLGQRTSSGDLRIL
jgi:hypothetical protein